MATTYPTTLQDLDATRGASGESMANPSHSTHHLTEDDTIEALQTKVGITGSAVTASHDYRIVALEAAPTPGDLLADGSIPLTANWDVGAYTITGTQFISDIAIGTAPFAVTSTTEVTNLKSATVGTIAGLAPDTATTQATQASITTCANLVTVGTVTTGNADAVVTKASAAEINTGTEAVKVIAPDQLTASQMNVRWLVFNLVEAATDTATATNIAGDFVSPIAGTILQSDSTPFYLYATNSTAGTTGTMVVDISIGGTSIMTTNKLDFDTTEKTTTTAATPPDLTTTALAVGDIITIDIDAIHTTAAKGLTVYMAVRE